MIEEKDEVNKNIIEKYRRLYRDHCKKEKYLPEGESLVSFTAVKKAIRILDLNKATGWELIKGDAFELIIKDSNPQERRDFI